MNQINVIFPYWNGYTWAFDDRNVGLSGEPFVAGMPEIINQMLDKKGIKKDDNWCLVFSKNKFPNYDFLFTWVEGDRSNKSSNGNWYKLNLNDAIGWLCPALFKYFDIAPENIYILIERTS